jgi:4-hydroxy-tetrahydrodipicolinate synthase
MSQSLLPRPLRGVVPPLVTPLTGRDTLDVGGLERLVEHVLAGGVAGLFILGTTGEGPALSYRLRRELIERVCRQVGCRVPVLIGVTDTAFAESVALARYAADAGAAAVVAAAPYYFRPSQPELLHYVRVLSAEVPLPLVLYNMPAHTKVAFAVETVRQAMAFDNVVGLKDSSGDWNYFHAVRELRAERDDWTLLMGPEQLLGEAVLFGADGGVPGGANLHPQLFVALYQAAARGDAERVAALQRDVLRLGRIYQVARGELAYLRGLKCALACAGLCADRLAEPFAPLAEAERAQVARLVEPPALTAPVREPSQPARAGGRAG